MISTGIPKPQAAMLLASLILAIFAAEILWLYGWYSANEALYLSNIRQASQNWLDQRKITDLKAAVGRIDGLYLRFQDPIAAG
jgi:hypothetical protein